MQTRFAHLDAHVSLNEHGRVDSNRAVVNDKYLAEDRQMCRLGVDVDHDVVGGVESALVHAQPWHENSLGRAVEKWDLFAEHTMTVRVDDGRETGEQSLFVSLVEELQRVQRLMRRRRWQRQAQTAALVQLGEEFLGVVLRVFDERAEDVFSGCRRC